MNYRLPAKANAVLDPTPFAAISIHEDLCIGCNACVEECQTDVFLPSADGGAPTVAHPGECWHEGSCVLACPVPGALTFKHLPTNQVRWVAR